MPHRSRIWGLLPLVFPCLAHATDARPAQLVTVDALLLELRGLEISGPPRPETVLQKELDRALTEQFNARTQRMQAIEAAAAPPRDAPAELRIALAGRVAEAWSDTAVAVERAFVPPYLTADQKELYALALADKADTMRERGLAALAGAPEIATAWTLTPDLLRALAIGARLERETLDLGQPGFGAPVPRPAPRPQPSPERAAAALAALGDAMARAPGCVSQDTRDDLRIALDLGHSLLDIDRADQDEEFKDFADSGMQDFVDAAALGLLGDWDCAGAPVPEDIEALPSRVRDSFGLRFECGYGRPGPPERGADTSLPTRWSPAPIALPPRGDIVTLNMLAARLVIAAAWRESWESTFVHPPASSPTVRDLDAIAAQAALPGTAMDAIEADAASLLADPHAAASARIALAAARVDAAEALARVREPFGPFAVPSLEYRAWHHAEVRAALVGMGFAALNTADELLDPLLAPGWPAPVKVDDNALAAARDVEARIVAVTTRFIGQTGMR